MLSFVFSVLGNARILVKSLQLGRLSCVTFTVLLLTLNGRANMYTLRNGMSLLNATVPL